MNKALADADMRNIGQKAKAVIQNDDRYLKAANDKLSADKELALALFDIALENDNKTIDQTCKELGLHSKNTSSIYHKIARIAFHKANQNLNTEVENRPQISKYAKVLEGAFHKKLSRTDFEKKLKNGFEKALNSLRLAVRGADDETENADNEKLALEHISSSFGQHEINTELKDIADGEFVELVAKVENGKLVVYGALPKKSDAIKDEIISNWQKTLPKPRNSNDLFLDIWTISKVITADGDETHASLNTNHGVDFSATSNKAFAVLKSSKQQSDFNNKKFSLSGACLVKIADDIKNVFNKEKIEIEIKGKKIVVTPKNSSIRDIIDKNQLPKTGEVDGESVVFKIETSELIYPPAILNDQIKEVILNKDQIDELSKLKLSEKKISYFEKKPIKVNKSEIRIIKRAAKALKKFGGGQLSLKYASGCLSLDASKDQSTYSIFIALEEK